MGRSSGRDTWGLAGSGKVSCLSLSLTVESRKGDCSPEASRRRSRGRAGDAVHLLRPVGPGCPLTGSRHLAQARTGSGVAFTWPVSPLGARGGVLSALGARGASEQGEGGRVCPQPPAEHWCRCAAIVFARFGAEHLEHVFCSSFHEQGDWRVS